MARSAGLNQPFENRRGNVERMRSMGVKLHTVTGKIYLTGRGTATVDIKFPVTFVQEPNMTFGAALGANSPFDAANPPTYDICVVLWDRVEKRAGANIGYYYNGATLSVSVGGSPEQTMWIHWKALEKAFRNPTSPGTGTTDGTA